MTTFGVDTEHPEYREYKQFWLILEDCLGGEYAIKLKSTQYLPPTQSMSQNGLQFMTQNGLLITDPTQQIFNPKDQAYRNYLKRAVYHGFIDYAVTYALGLLHIKPPTIQLPAGMEGLREHATPKGESLIQLLKMINKEQLETGRCGLVVDFPEQGTVKTDPYICLYEAHDIINWDGEDDKPNFVVIREDNSVREGFGWKQGMQYRVLSLDESGRYISQTYTRETIAQTNGGAVVGDMLQEEIKPVSLKGALNFVPFVFCNSDSTSLCPSKPPYLDLAYLSLAIYRGEADYRQSLFMQGQDTLVIAGPLLGQESDKPSVQIGAGGGIYLSSTDGRAEFIGVNSSGLSEQRIALENDIARAWQLAGSLNMDQGGKTQSGEALSLRFTSQTTQLTEIAQTGAKALQATLRNMAIWLGENPEEVVVTPNTDFIRNTIKAADLVDLAKARSLGAPITDQDMYLYAYEHGFIKTETFEEQQAILTAEEGEKLQPQPQQTQGKVANDLNAD